MQHIWCLTEFTTGKLSSYGQNFVSAWLWAAPSLPSFHPCGVPAGQALFLGSQNVETNPPGSEQPFQICNHRTTGKFRLEWTSRGHLLQCPSPEQSQLWSQIHSEAQSSSSISPLAKLSSFQRLETPQPLWSMLNHLHWDEFSPSLCAVFLVFRGVHCLQPLRTACPCSFTQISSWPSLLYFCPGFHLHPPQALAGALLVPSAAQLEDGLAPLWQSSSVPGYLHQRDHSDSLPFLGNTWTYFPNFASTREERRGQFPTLDCNRVCMKIKYLVHRAGETWDKLISQPMRMTPLSPSYPWCPKSPAQAQINPGLSLCRLCTGRNQHSEIAEFFFLVYLYSSWIVQRPYQQNISY